MKNKGFTMIELIVTIGIMALIGVMIGTNMLGLFSSEEDKEYESFINKIQESACMYVETVFDSVERSNCRSNGCTITIHQLIQKGYIADDLKDPSTGDKVLDHANDFKVQVFWENDVKKCKINGVGD